MSARQDSTPPADAPRQHTDEDDHDLLTFGEVGERLRLEIAALTAQVAELRETGRTEELATASARLSALQAAARRNSVSPINDATFEKFFGYPGKARQNLPRTPSGS